MSSKQWYINNPDYNKNYYYSNTEAILSQKKQYRKTDKGKACQQRANAKRTHSSAVAIISTLTSNEWQAILDKYNYKCAYCGKDFNISNLPTRDHIIPISAGGNNVEENVVPACRECNSKKGAKQFVKGGIDD